MHGQLETDQARGYCPPPVARLTAEAPLLIQGSNRHGRTPKDRILSRFAEQDRKLDRQSLAIKLATEVLGESDLDLAISTLVENTHNVVGCDRVSIFLVEGDKLVCKASPDGGPVGWSIPLTSGIAGSVASTGKTINIADVYDRPDLFDPTHDKQTGYRTRSLLCMPMTRKQKIVGVMQLINKLDPTGHNDWQAFDPTDEANVSLLLSITAQEFYVAELAGENGANAAVAQDLLRLMDVLSQEQGLHEAMEALASTIQRMADCELAYIFLRSSNKMLACWAMVSSRPRDNERKLIGVGAVVDSSDEDIIAEVARTGRTEMIGRSDNRLQKLACRLQDCKPEECDCRLRSALCSPMIDVRSNDLVGVVLLINKFSSAMDISVQPAPASPPQQPPGRTAKRQSSLKVRKLSSLEAASAQACGLPDAALDDFKPTDRTRVEQVLGLAGKMVVTARLHDVQKRANKKLEALLYLMSEAKSALEAKNLQRLLSIISTQSTKMFECDRCTFFIVDQFTHELVGYYASSDEDLDEFRVPMVGICGTVATTGQQLNIQDAWSDERFSNKLDLASGYRTRTILCAPLMSTSGKVIAVLQCINKNHHEVFGTADEQMMSTLSILLSDILHRMLLSSSYNAFVQKSDTIDAEIKDIVREYYSASNNTRKASMKLGGCRGKTREKVSEHHGTDEAMMMIAAARSWTFDHVTLNHDDNDNMIPLYIQLMFDHLGLFNEFSMEPDKFTSFVTSIRLRYNATAAYHNWHHAFATLHVVFLLLNCKAFLNVLGATETVALLLAALGHDVEHQGTTNAFHVVTESVLAIRYNDVSVLENHHAAVTSSVLKGPGSNPLNSVEARKMKRVRSIIVSSILGTDMAKHADCIAWLESSAVNIPALRNSTEPPDAETSTKLCSSILHCADVAHPILPWKMHKKFSLDVATEFFQQYTEETRLGLPTLPFMGKDPSDLKGLAPTQVGFLQFVVAPLYSALSFCAGGDLMLFAVQNLQHNKQTWQRLADGEEDVAEEQPFTEPP
eukprot:TRINITY_DN90295_c0_g1_i1.p1 TRINITY_DN90295_c0_g1~~TRINITY_DN90295_c0_g1_i1.p1  ORF type:complete len:1020 (-),score=154.30 TRINITY_DN90295_c0_g1_i1:118-3177(-)